ncbi:hemerythrin domain-containing protein [Paracoccus sp. (in: a-proteobacteria)]|uniref:hemerythrin domain-containing protein n=1 Tax=Paracoccus sp. TaxID=267 RepID=UPI0035B325C3
MDDDFKLGTRSDLPGDQLFLLRDFPRGTWRGRPGLAGTGEIWLANHDRFRALTHGILQALERLRDSGETGHDSAPALQRDIARLLAGLDGHHRIEDQHYFPAFQRAEPRLLRGFQILDGDHHLIHESIDELAAVTQDSLRRLGQTAGVMTGDQRRALDALADVSGRFAPLLRQHLADEEDLVIPLILERARLDPEFS